MTDNRKANILTKALFLLYMIALLWIIVFKFGIAFSEIGSLRTINLIPFGASLILNGRLHVNEIVMNVLIFLPLGIYSGVLFQRWTVWQKLLLFFATSLLCEGLQFALGIGASDITDLITNTAGGFLGLAMYHGTVKICKSNGKAQQFINITAVIGTILMVILLSLVILNHLWIFRAHQ
jgi:glycopeptide antibiotics resistance protein